MQPDTLMSIRPKSSPFHKGVDITILGSLFLLSGIIDLIWILSYPHYALTVFGTTFSGWVGEFVKFQHPILHLVIGVGFIQRRPWALWTYMVYLGLAVCSEVITQMIQGYHPLRTNMIILSLAFGLYIFFRRRQFQ